MKKLPVRDALNHGTAAMVTGSVLLFLLLTLAGPSRVDFHWFILGNAFGAISSAVLLWWIVKLFSRKS